jgi:hypothetical protein
VDDTSGLGLFKVLLESMESIGLNIEDIRFQGYDNGSNMKGKEKGGTIKVTSDESKSILYAMCLP